MVCVTIFSYRLVHVYFLAYSRLSIFIGKINFFNALVYFLFEPSEIWLLSGVIFLISSHGSKMCTWSVVGQCMQGGRGTHGSCPF